MGETVEELPGGGGSTGVVSVTAPELVFAAALLPVTCVDACDVDGGASAGAGGDPAGLTGVRIGGGSDAVDVAEFALVAALVVDCSAVEDADCMPPPAVGCGAALTPGGGARLSVVIVELPAGGRLGAGCAGGITSAGALATVPVATAGLPGRRSCCPTLSG